MKKTILAMTLALTCLSANAEIVIGDWKEQGDGLLRLDTETGKEWIDTMQTWEMSINSVQNEFGAGGMFEGFRVAGYRDVERMVESMFSVSDLALIANKFENTSGSEFIGNYRYLSSGNNYQAFDSDAVYQVQLFSSLFKTGLVEKSYYNREEDIFIYNRFLYLSNEVDIHLNGLTEDDVHTLNNYVKIQNEGEGTYGDNAFFHVNDVNGSMGSAYASIFLVADDLNSYSFNNDSDYRAAKEAGELNFANDVPVQGLFALPFLGVFAASRRKKVS